MTGWRGFDCAATNLIAFQSLKPPTTAKAYLVNPWLRPSGKKSPLRKVRSRGNAVRRLTLNLGGRRVAACTQGVSNWFERLWIIFIFI